MALLAPIPRASVSTAAAVNPGVRARARAPRRASCQSVSRNRMRTSGLLTGHGGEPLTRREGGRGGRRARRQPGRRTGTFIIPAGMTQGYSGGGNHITRAIILARGLGTRMRERAQAGAAVDAAQAEAADRGVKAMIPIGRPFLDYVLSALADAGYTDACLVIGPEHDAIRE